jgi:AmmeMemoRadiSam system protein A
VDEDLAQKISQVSGFSYIPAAHKEEHSIEVQIPFIQKTLPQTKIVPILMGIPSRDTITKLAESLKQTLSGRNVLLIVSTDMSHYFPKEKATAVDNETISLIKSLDTDSLMKKVQRRENIMCGGGGVVSALIYARTLGTPRIEILRYADSSATGGGDTKVVGYLSAAVYSKPRSQPFSLTDEEKTELLNVARSAVTLYVQKKEILRYEPQTPSLFTEKGAFVTLKKLGRLRGCIGYIEPVAPLHLTITQAAISAASQDNRFPPVQPSELPDLEYEISVLSLPRKIDSPDEVIVGRHGLIIVQGARKGVLLPQVPVENRWSRKTFLQQACLKAGLPQNAWSSGAEVFIFEAIVFH